MAVCLFLFLLFNQSNSLGTRLLRKLVASPWVSNNADNHLIYINYAKIYREEILMWIPMPMLNRW